MKDRKHYDFESYFKYFIDQITGEGEDFKDTLYRKVISKAFKNAEHNVNLIINEILNDIEEGCDFFRNEIAEKMSEEFSEFYWEKFENGHEWYAGSKCICYFKETDKYFIGTAIDQDGGTKFLLENGKFSEPDYIAPLYEFKEKE